MKPKHKLLFAITLFTLGAASCKNKCKDPSGKVITQNRDVTAFRKLNVKGAFDVMLVQDGSSRVEVIADENFMEAVKTESDGTGLTIKQEGDCEGDPIKLLVHSADYSEITFSGAVEARTQGKLKLKDVELNYAGRVHADLDINAANVETSAAGKVDVKMKGQASRHNVNIAGSGSLDAFDFVAARYNVETAGATECRINVLNELTVNSTGSGDVTYKGNPGKINQDIKGSGEVKKVP